MRSTKILTYLGLLILCLNGLGIQAQDAPQAQGKVSASIDGTLSPLYGANVHWAGTGFGTSTNEQGEFSLDLMDRTSTLVISFAGYVNDTIIHDGSYIEATLQEGIELAGVSIDERKESTALFLMDPLNTQSMNEKELRKAACCNLSESFETNASIDASFTDAVTGTRQIKMLGLSGRYSQILRDNIPNVRGLSTIFGLGYIPGDWISNIHVSKGAGSVTTGHESITGEINVALKDAYMEEKAHFNVYGNQGGRMEFNGLGRWKVSDTWSTILLTHAETNQTEMDRNGDGFLDNPLKEDFTFRNQWRFQAKEHWEGQYAITYLSQNQNSGQTANLMGDGLGPLWEMNLDAERLEAEAKTGYVFDDPWGSSIGSQFSVQRYELDMQAGNTEVQGLQESYRANLLYATKLGCMKKALVVGLTGLIDQYSFSLNDEDLGRREASIGAYGEFTWTPSERFMGILGMRADHHNMFGMMYSPRLHARYSLRENLSIKGALGRGYRTANPVMDNLGLLASSRSWSFQEKNIQEAGWNAGLNLTHKFRIDYRDASLAVDVYRTWFERAAVIDMETFGAVQVYALEDGSYANTAQAEFSWEMMRRTDIRLAYRYTDARTGYVQGERMNPYTPQHRGFFNIGYESKATDKDAQWKIDATVQLIGRQRLPDIEPNWPFILGSAIHEPYSPTFAQVHGQLTRVFKKGLELYIGIENGTDYRQEKPILGAETPFSENFDASRVWGPVFGRMAYGGLRWTVY